MIDVKFDFTLDSPGYWDRFWENNEGLGGGGFDPDSASVVLQRYNQELCRQNGWKIICESQNHHTRFIVKFNK